MKLTPPTNRTFGTATTFTFIGGIALIAGLPAAAAALFVVALALLFAGNLFPGF